MCQLCNRKQKLVALRSSTIWVEMTNLKGYIHTLILSLTISFINIISLFLSSLPLTCLPLKYSCLQYIIYMLLRVMIFPSGEGQLGHRGKQCLKSQFDASVWWWMMDAGMHWDENAAMMALHPKNKRVCSNLLPDSQTSVQVWHINTMCVFSNLHLHAHACTHTLSPCLFRSAQ